MARNGFYLVALTIITHKSTQYKLAYTSKTVFDENFKLYFCNIEDKVLFLHDKYHSDEQ